MPTFSLGVVFLFLMGETQGIQFDNKNGNNLGYVFSNPDERRKIKDFIENVLRQCNADKFLEIGQEISKHSSPLLNADFYKKLEERLPETKPLIPLFSQLSSLKHQRAVISSQIQKLIIHPHTIKSYMELGAPGTYITSLRSFLPIENAVAVCNQASFLGFSFNPLRKFKSYDRFVPLNDYQPLSEKDFPTNSVDLVSLVIGLHHIPPEKLEPFIRSIHRILKPGGFFILRDHDAKDDNTKAIVQAAHTVYNLVAVKASLDEEISEYRNFQPLSYWIRLLSEAGFQGEGEKLYEQGDPTLNAMMVFVKPLHSLKDVEETVGTYPGYKREPSQTFLSAPEWQNVLAAEEYARFIQHTPFYEFPYMESIGSYWSVFFNCWKSAKKESSTWGILTSDYTFMNLFVGLFMTLEYSVKALISAPIRWFIGGAEPQTIQILVKDPGEKLAHFCPEAKIIEDFNLDGLKLVQFPRYKKLQKVLETLPQFPGIEIISISGNKSIQLTVKHSSSLPLELMHHEGIEKLYEFSFPTMKSEKFTALLVKTSSFRNIFKVLSEKKIALFHLHDF